jgi:hypothetical protein
MVEPYEYDIDHEDDMWREAYLDAATVLAALDALRVRRATA